MKDFTEIEKAWLETLGKQVENKVPTYQVTYDGMELEVCRCENNYVAKLEQHGVSIAGNGKTARDAILDTLKKFQKAVDDMQENLESIQSTLVVFLISED